MVSYNSLVGYGCVCFIGVIIFTGWLLWRYARPGCPIIPLILTYLSWLIVFSLCFLVPMELIPIFENALNSVWKVLFWASFLLMWIIIPFASGYYDNGGFTIKHKLWMSFKFNLYLIIIIGIIGVGGMIYLVVAAKWSMDDISGLLVCASNTWGIIMLVVCAGFGLVEFPRNIYYLRDYKRRQDHIYYFSASIHDEQEKTWDELGATIAMLDTIENKIEGADNEKHRRWMIQIRNVVREREIELQQSGKRTHPIDMPFLQELKSTQVISTNQMFKLHYMAKTLVRHLSLVETQWRDTVDDAVSLELELAQQTDPAQISWWLKTGRKQSYLVFAISGAILSLLLVVGETFIPASQSSRAATPLAWIVAQVKDNFLLQQIFTAIPFLYLSICVYYPFFLIRLSKLYYIGRKRTDEGTLLFNATLLLRVCVPLAYNFVLLLHMPAKALEELIGVITVIPFFGGSFTTIFPVFILVLNFFQFFRIFDRIGACLNMDEFKFAVSDRIMDEDLKDKMNEGRTLIQAELNRRSKVKKQKQVKLQQELKSQQNSVNNNEYNEDEQYYDEEQAEYNDQEYDEEQEYIDENNTTNTTQTASLEDEDLDEQEINNIALNQNSFAGATYAQYALAQPNKSNNILSNALSNNNTAQSGANPIFKPQSSSQVARNFKDSAKFASPAAKTASNKFSWNHPAAALSANKANNNINNTSNNKNTNNIRAKSAASDDEPQFDEEGNMIV